MDMSLENETRSIYKEAVTTLLKRDGRYKSLGAAELEAVVQAFEFTLKNGSENVRAQMLYDLIHEKRAD